MFPPGDRPLCCLDPAPLKSPVQQQFITGERADEEDKPDLKDADGTPTDSVIFYIDDVVRIFSPKSKIDVVKIFNCFIIM